MKANSSITLMKDFVFSWKSLPDKSSMIKLNLHNLNHCDSLTSFHLVIQSHHQSQVEASPKDNKKNYLKLKIFTKRLSMNLEIIFVNAVPIMNISKKVEEFPPHLHQNKSSTLPITISSRFKFVCENSKQVFTFQYNYNT
ncbi:CLUMA_CG003550, isoform A [Clunio marinus]|uniref:CLUMA_CG003550, isoform A n=1 Tax=Clunio marinus TaxID=568069 RepID=A0A1J1HPJ2_9DIPT|nr:CLUMA_CG003550, isoform A [Clunio marinus]